MSIPMLHYRELHDRLQDRLPGAGVPWVTLMRGEAMAAFQQRAFPDTRVEAWKYTDLRRLNRHVFTPPPAAGPLGADALQSWTFGTEPMHRLVFVDGRFAAHLNPCRLQLNGARLDTIAQLLTQDPDRLEAVLGRTLEADTPGFNSMNTAFLQDGVYLRLERDTVLDKPLHLLFISTGQPGSMMTVRNVIEAAPGSCATLIESWVALNGAEYLSNAITEVTLGDGATLDHYRLVQDSESALHVGALYVRQGSNSRLRTHGIALGGRLVRNELQVSLDGPGAACALNGLTVTHGNQHVDNHTRIDHHAARATSDEWYRGIVDDRSRTVFSGRIVVHPQAFGTRAQQSNHSLLLSAEAEADARPQFEIHADDVQCSHGCTVGELDTDALFYLRSRALDEAAARRLMIRAFASDILERMPLAPVRDYLERQLATRLTAGGTPPQEVLH
jgi:Fe-S cluster assembly protein SufD